MDRLRYSHWQSLLLALAIAMAVWPRVQSESSFDPEAICEVVTNGTRIKDPRACNVWIECANGVPIEGKCENRLFFNHRTGECVDADSIRCISSDPCAPANGDVSFQADPYSCRYYYYCDGDRKTKGDCGLGFTFSMETRACIKNFPCNLIDPDSLCNVVPDGVFVRQMDSCNKWQMCWKDDIITGICPGTFYFNPMNGACDYQTNVDCVPPSPPPANVPSSRCSAPGDFISDERTCNGYYYCSSPSPPSTGGTLGDYELIAGTCPRSRFFVATDGGSCVDRTLTTCPYDRCAGLGQTKIQLANAKDDTCQSYLICQNNVTIGTGQCPGAQYFDELQQRCVDEVISYPACASISKSSLTSVSTIFAPPLRPIIPNDKA